MKTIVSMALVCLTITSFAQRKTAVFDDGTKVDYEMKSRDHKDSPELMLSFFPFSFMQGPTMSFVQGSIYKADKFLAEVGLGIGAYASGTYFLTSNNEEKELLMKLKSEYTSANSVTVYTIKYNAIQSKNFGLHGELGYAAKMLSLDSVKRSNIFMALGIGSFRGRHYSAIAFPDGKPTPLNYTGRRLFYADLILSNYIRPLSRRTVPMQLGVRAGFQVYRLGGKRSNGIGLRFGMGVLNFSNFDLMGEGGFAFYLGKPKKL